MILTRIVLGLAVAAAAIQLIRPARTNPPENAAGTIEATLKPPAAVAGILQRSCQDCHSNRTVWPWYSEVAPVSWMVIHHVNEGRERLNFSNWAGYDAGEAHTLLERMCREVDGQKMPIYSYTFIHRNAVLRDADRQAICDWTKQTAR